MVKWIVCFGQKGALLLMWGTKPWGLFNRESDLKHSCSRDRVIGISSKCLQALTLLNRPMISRFGVCSHHWLCVLCWQVFEELLLDADWSVNAGMWMWLSCSSFFQQFFHCYCPVGFGKRADPTGDFIRYFIHVS